MCVFLDRFKDQNIQLTSLLNFLFHIISCSHLSILFVHVIQDRIKDLNSQADQFVEAQVWEAESINERKRTINERYEK